MTLSSVINWFLDIDIARNKKGHYSAEEQNFLGTINTLCLSFDKIFICSVILEELITAYFIIL